MLDTDWKDRSASHTIVPDCRSMGSPLAAVLHTQLLASCRLTTAQRKMSNLMVGGLCMLCQSWSGREELGRGSRPHVLCAYYLQACVMQHERHALIVGRLDQKARHFHKTYRKIETARLCVSPSRLISNSASKKDTFSSITGLWPSLLLAKRAYIYVSNVVC